MKHFVLMCLLLYIHTSQSQIHHQNSTVGGDVILYCKHEGKVVWSKDKDGNRGDILTAEKHKDEIQKHIKDPHNRYSVTDELELHIKNVSLSDSGIYYCNANATVNLTVRASNSSKPNTSSNDQKEATTPPAETSITSVSQTSNTHHPHQPNSSQAAPTSENSSVFNTLFTSTAAKSNTSSTSIESPTPPPTESSKIAVAVSGGIVFVVLVLVLWLLLWAWIKRNAALSNKKENIYETAEDSDFTAQPVPMQKPTDAIYYLAGDPDIVDLGQIKEMDDPTYTLISQPKENITEQEGDVPLYSTIKADTINQP